VCGLFQHAEEMRNLFRGFGSTDAARLIGLAGSPRSNEMLRRKDYRLPSVIQKERSDEGPLTPSCAIGSNFAPRSFVAALLLDDNVLLYEG
jgi:hypothetical protein